MFVFANPGEKAAYDEVLPLYFPRNKPEQYRAVALLPEDVGNESGETVVAERQVRVGESYHAAAAATHGLAAPTGYEHDGAIFRSLFLPADFRSRLLKFARVSDRVVGARAGPD